MAENRKGAKHRKREGKRKRERERKGERERKRERKRKRKRKRKRNCFVSRVDCKNIVFNFLLLFTKFVYLYIHYIFI